MALTKEVTIGQMEVVGRFKAIQVRTDTIKWLADSGTKATESSVKE